MTDPKLAAAQLANVARRVRTLGALAKVLADEALNLIGELDAIRQAEPRVGYEGHTLAGRVIRRTALDATVALSQVTDAHKHVAEALAALDANVLDANLAKLADAGEEAAS